MNRQQLIDKLFRINLAAYHAETGIDPKDVAVDHFHDWLKARPEDNEYRQVVFADSDDEAARQWRIGIIKQHLNRQRYVIDQPPSKWFVPDRTRPLEIPAYQKPAHGAGARGNLYQDSLLMDDPTINLRIRGMALLKGWLTRHSGVFRDDEIVGIRRLVAGLPPDVEAIFHYEDDEDDEADEVLPCA